MGLAVIKPTYPYIRWRVRRLSDDDRKLYFMNRINGDARSDLWLARRLMEDRVIDVTESPYSDAASGYHEDWLLTVNNVEFAQLLIEFGADPTDALVLQHHSAGTAIGDYLRKLNEK